MSFENWNTRQKFNLNLTSKEKKMSVTKKDLINHNELMLKFEFVKSFNDVADKVLECNKQNGWINKERNKGELIALVHSELSEALEALRHGNPPSEHIPEFSGFEEELADVIIRLMDLGTENKLRIAEAVLAKIKFNLTRGYRHGNKVF